jgi:hypothetical protein
MTDCDLTINRTKDVCITYSYARYDDNQPVNALLNWIADRRIILLLVVPIKTLTNYEEWSALLLSQGEGIVFKCLCSTLYPLSQAQLHLLS